MKKLIFWVIWPLSLVGIFYIGRLTSQYLSHDKQPTLSLNEEMLSSRTWVKQMDQTLLQSTQSLQTLRSKFLKPYPQNKGPHNALYEQEIMDRLYLLQKIAQQTNPKNIHPDLLSLYKFILENKNESWVVQRQALKNLAPYWSHWTENERDRLLSQVDLRARNTWTLLDVDFVRLFGEDL